MIRHLLGLFRPDAVRLTEERARLIEFGVVWSEMSKAERAQVLQHIASDLPKGWTVEKAQ